MNLKTTFYLVNVATVAVAAILGWLSGGVDGTIVALCAVAALTALCIDDNTRNRS